jgi:NAD(P)-dependent dehydrogenase (short-subunit alcohol dehydrogenase family)
LRGLKDRVAVATGGGQGIGRALTLRFAETACKSCDLGPQARAAKETEKLTPLISGGLDHHERAEALITVAAPVHRPGPSESWGATAKRF